MRADAVVVPTVAGERYIVSMFGESGACRDAPGQRRPQRPASDDVPDCRAARTFTRSGSAPTSACSWRCSPTGHRVI